MCVVVAARSAGPAERDGCATLGAVEGQSVGALYELRHHAQLRAAGQAALRRQGAPATPTETAAAAAATEGTGSRNRVT